MITARFNALGYIVYSDDEEIYSAGNSPYDSQGFVCEEQGVGAFQVQQFAITTCIEVAEERGETFWHTGSVTFDPDLFA